jgi:putative hydrolase of the HAD superfamily
MIETAIDLTDGRVRGDDIKRIITAVREMMAKEIQLLDHVAETIPLLAEDRTLMMITKGDLLDQESKVARSGLADHFQLIEIVSEKSEESYRKVLSRNGVDLDTFLMVGNSMRSDILPILTLGAPAVHIPYQYTWVHERVATDPDSDGFFRLQHVAQLPPLLKRLESR